MTHEGRFWIESIYSWFRLPTWLGSLTIGSAAFLGLLLLGYYAAGALDLLLPSGLLFVSPFYISFILCAELGSRFTCNRIPERSLGRSRLRSLFLFAAVAFSPARDPLIL